MKKIILITDVVKELSVEKKFLSNYNLILKKINNIDLKSLSNIRGIITGHEIFFDKVLISKFPNCKAIVRYGVGYNNIDLNFAKKKILKFLMFRIMVQMKLQMWRWLWLCLF